MSTFKKYWFRGGPPEEVQSTDKNYKFWGRGKPLALLFKTANSQTVIISEVLHLELTQYEPYVPSTIIVTPPCLHLTFTQYEPFVPEHVVVECELQSLNLTLYEPEVLIGAKLYETLHCVLTLYSPSVATSTNVVVSVSTRHLWLTKHNPTILSGCKITVGKKSLYFTLHAPFINTGVSIEEVLHLNFSLYEPTIDSSYTVQVGTQHLILTKHTPTVNFGYAVEVEKQSLTFTLHEPQVITGVRLYETLHLILSHHEPDVHFDLDVLISEVLHTILSQQAVTVITTTNITARPSLQHLVFALHEPQVTTGVRLYETLHLTFTKFEPSINTSSVNVVDLLSLLLNLYDPIVCVSVKMEVDLQSLVFQYYEVEVKTGARLYETLHLVLSQHEPIIFYGVTAEAELLHLVFEIYDPRIFTIPPADLYVVDPLHKELDWGSEFTLGESTYAYRADSILSNNFPFKSTDTDKLMTACFWVRFKTLGEQQPIFMKLRSTEVASPPSIGLQMLGASMVLTWGYGSSLFTNLYFTRFTFVTDRWYHIGLVVDGIERTVFFQVWDDYLKIIDYQKFDGYAPPSIPGPIEVGGGPFQIGYWQDSASHNHVFFNGYLDEFVLFNKLKSSVDIDQIRRGTYSGSRDGQVIDGFGLTTSIVPQGGVNVGGFALMNGYDAEGKITTSDFGLTVAYSVATPPLPILPPVIVGYPSPGSNLGSYTMSNLKYKFKSEVSSLDWGTDDEARSTEFTLPSRELETMMGVADESSYIRWVETMTSGATIFSIPIWGLRTSLAKNTHAGFTEFVAEDVSNLYVGEKVLLLRANDASIYDLCHITNIAGSTVTIQESLNYHYHKYQMMTTDVWYDERSSYVLPCLTGVVDVENFELIANKPTFFIRAKINGGAWINAPSPEMPSTVSSPAESHYINPKVERSVLGTENGILSMMSQLSSAKLAFETEWYFKDDSWKDFRDFFLASRGRLRSFYMPTFCFELRVQEFAAQGSTTIALNPGYVNLMERFSRLFIVNLRTPTQSSTIISGFNGGNSFTCTPLTYDVYTGDKVCFYPQVRFIEDEIVFEFLYYNECKIKTSFVEVIS